MHTKRTRGAPVRNVACANNNIFIGVIVARLFFFSRYRLPAGLHLLLRYRSFLPARIELALLVSRAGTRAIDLSAIINDYGGARRIPWRAATGADNHVR